MKRLLLTLFLGALGAAAMALPPVLSQSFSPWPPAGWSLPPSAAGERWEGSEGTATANYTGGEGTAATARPQSGGDLDLRTPAFALPAGATGAVLRFREDLLLREGSADVAEIALSTDGGATFPHLLRRREGGGAGGRGPLETTVDLSAWAGEAALVVRFRYGAVAGSDHGWWQVDDVRVEARSCPSTALVLEGPPYACPPGALLTAGEGWSSYRWFRNGILLPGATGESLLAGLSGTYTVEGTDAEGCAVLSAPLEVTVESPAPPVVQGPSEGCPGGAVVLTASGTSGGGTLQWYRDGLPIPGATGDTLAVLEGGTFEAVFATAGGCEAHSAPHTVSFSPALSQPQVLTAACDGALLEAPLGLAAWTWTRDGLPLPGASGPALAVEESGAYAVAGWTPTGCALQSPPAEVVLAPRPSVAVEAEPCPGGATLQALGVPGPVRWEAGGRELPAPPSATLRTTLPGLYTALAETAPGCERRSLPVAVEIPPCASREVSGPGAFYPLTVERISRKDGSPALRLSFEKAPGAVTYALFWGTLGQPGSHREPGHALCGLVPEDDGSGRLEVTVEDLPSDAYFLLAADLGGGLLTVAGQDSGGTPILPGSCGP
ncbi:MAG: hypothetical protein ACP5VN_02465 [Acidobacteriota bacterium]